MTGKVSTAELESILEAAFHEDVRDGDHTSLACIGTGPRGKARLLVKEEGIIAGVQAALAAFAFVDDDLRVDLLIADGEHVKPGDEVFHVHGSALSILTSERVVLNMMQRMSGIASRTSDYVRAVQGTHARVIDTRKTTPGIRVLEKWAVRIGGGSNHRMGLFDMILIKDNHIDFCGGITQAIDAAGNYLGREGLGLKIEIETRSMEEVREVLEHGGVDRIMLDNFSPAQLAEAISLIDGRLETEASGGITMGTIREYAETGVDFISVGALTHSAVALDMSLKAVVDGR